MNNVVIMGFTTKGYALAKTIELKLANAGYKANAYKVTNLREFVPNVFKKGNILLFVGAAGIAVRAVSGLLKSKATDPAVVVTDELGRYVIPILSGHLGGGNLFAEKLAGLIKAVPVITTATDINGVFSIDTFAAQNNYSVVNPENIKYISAALLEGNEVGFSTDFNVDGKLPENVVIKQSGPLGIYIGADRQRPFAKTLVLAPKYAHLGVGAKKNISSKELLAFAEETLGEAGIGPELVGSVSSIHLKKEEEAIIGLAAYYGVEFITYSGEQLAEIDAGFQQSDFVRKITGAGNVCEGAAWLSSKQGEIIVKRVKNGMTLAVAKERWRVRFGNTDDRD